MRLSIKGERIIGEIEAISSKSIFHRALILASFSEKKIKISFNALSKDILKTLEILNSLGTKLTIKKQYVEICKGNPIHEVDINFGESGSSLRFLLPYIFLHDRKAFLSAERRLSERPIKDLVEQISKNGVNLSSKKLPFTGRGSFYQEDKVFRFPGNISSQYISGILMIAPFMKGKTRIIIEGRLESKPYVDMTIKIMKDFGLIISENDFGYEVCGEQKIKDIRTYIIEGDYSNSATFIASGIIGGEMIIRNLKYPSIQGDSKIIEEILKSGGNIEIFKDFVIVKKSDIKGFDIDCSDIPDLVPVLSVLAHYSTEKSILRNVNRLRLKESDRIESLLNLFERVGGDCKYINGDLHIEPARLHGNRIESFNDHRIVMAATVVAVLSREEVEIDGFEAIEKSYPDYVEELKKIGMEVID